MSSRQPDLDAALQYDPTPYDLELTDNPEMTWEQYSEIHGPGARPCLIVVPEREAEAEAG